MLKNIASKLAVAAVLVTSICSPLCAQEEPAAGGIGIQPKAVGEAAPVDEASLIQKISLIFGYNAIGKMAFDMKRQGLDLDMDEVLRGAKMAADEEDLGMEREEVARLVTSLQGVMREKKTKMIAEAAKKNKTDGEAFLAENEKKEGVKKLDNGVQYEIITAGEGAKPTPEDKVKLHYHGTTTDGKVFDSSVEKGQPIVHSASGFVKGFNAAVQAMPVGSKWRVTIPSDLAYGASGPPSIGPNRTLIFEIELLEIVADKASK